MKAKLLFLAVFTSTAIQFSYGQIKKILVEEHTGTWCGWCPYGALQLDTLEKFLPGKVIPVAMHGGDKYSLPEESTIGKELQYMYLPSISIDRHFWTKVPQSQQNWGDFQSIFLMCNSSSNLTNLDTFALNRLNVKAPCSVTFSNVNYNSSTGKLTVTVNADFSSPENGDIRFNLYLTEDSILTHNEQVNDMNSDGNSTFYGKGNPFYTWYQNHLLRAIPGGAWGTAGIIPATVSAGQKFSNTYTVTLSSKYNFNNLNIIGVVQKYDTSYTQREIVNCEMAKLSSFITTGVSIISPNISPVEVYPNPMENSADIRFFISKPAHTSVEVFNTLGERVESVMNENLSEGSHIISWNTALSNGMYYVATKFNDVQQVSRIQIIR